MSLRRVTAVILAVGLMAAGACSDDDGGGDDATGDGDATTTEAGDGEGLAPPERAEGPAATVSGPLEGGNGIGLVTGTPGPDLAAAGWVEEEFRVAGTATSYAWADGAEEMPADGAFELVEADEADYATRVVVRRPGSPEDFSGTVVVEWLNVSAGFDASPDYTYMADELVRAGHAWVGVSAQRIGIEGGPVLVEVGPAAAAGAGEGLKALDPERYGDLSHPGDAFAFDIYTQVARALRDPGEVPALGDLVPDRVLATGESQSAFALTTYVNGVQPLTGAFDAFLVHSRGGASMPLGTPGEGVDLASSVGGNPVRIRTDGAAPVVILQMENDVVGLLGFLPARQDDAELLRLWEVAGTSHADAFQAGVAVDMLGCEGQVNAGPQQFLVRTALRALDTWVRTGDAPPEAPRIEVDESGAQPAIVRDDDGIALGGIRTPVVDVPVDVLSGESAGGSIACELFGSTVPLPDERLAELYDGVDDYMDRFTAATDEAVEAGWVLDDDRELMLDEAQPDRLAG